MVENILNEVTGKDMLRLSFFLTDIVCDEICYVVFSTIDKVNKNYISAI